MSEVKIDVEFLLNTPGTALHCANEEEARQFLHYLKDNYPEWCEEWEENETRINSCYGDGIGYTFYWQNDNGEWIKDILMFGDISAIRDDGYDVLELWELMSTKELEESDKPIDILFGGAV